MKTKFITLVTAIIAMFFTIILLGFASKNKLSIDGAWYFVEIQVVKSNGTYTSTYPKESLAIFFDNYYSFCWTSHDSTDHNWQLADSVKVNRFNQSIINTGSFELKDSILTTKATFALSPKFTNGLAKFKCYFVGDTLILRGLSVASSDYLSHPIYTSGSYVINKLVRRKSFVLKKSLKGQKRENQNFTIENLG